MAQEEEICTNISESVKMAGFLEKKGKMFMEKYAMENMAQYTQHICRFGQPYISQVIPLLVYNCPKRTRPSKGLRLHKLLVYKIVSPWKRYWFVLEERLLLYYRSQIEYINLSPCRGSLNMGLVTTVRPGSSVGPCVIHVITRTQVVQLRAKNRETQEEWLQALLDSMSLPLLCKTLRTPFVTDLHGHRYSMDNIYAHGSLSRNRKERKDTEYRKKEMTGSFYGGSLDAVIWSKKFRTLRDTSPNIPKGRMLEKILGYVGEIDTKSMSDMVSLIDDDGRGSFLSLNKTKCGTDKGGKSNEVQPNEESKEVTFNKKAEITKVRKSLSDDDMNKTIALIENDGQRIRTKEESQFKRIKNAMKKTKDKTFKNKIEEEKKPSTLKKRRRSFLEKVFKKHYRREEKESTEHDSDTDDPLYDTIDNINIQKEGLISESAHSSQDKTEDLTIYEEENIQVVDEETKLEKIDHSEDNGITHPQIIEPRPIFGSKSILTAQAMSELRTKLRSRESTDNYETEIVKNKQIGTELVQETETTREIKNNDEINVPALPPRRHNSRPKSPWHDVPLNNSPIDAPEASFNVYQGGVKFYDIVPVLLNENPGEVFQTIVELEGGAIDELKTQETLVPGERNLEPPKENNLSALLEQLTEMTTATLPESDLKGEKDCNSSSECDEIWRKLRIERFSDPDYDVPRPHKLINLCISDEGDKDDDTQFFTKSTFNSDSTSPFQSIEPDSLESTEKKLARP